MTHLTMVSELRFQEFLAYKTVKVITIPLNTGGTLFEYYSTRGRLIAEIKITISYTSRYIEKESA